MKFVCEEHPVPSSVFDGRKTWLDAWIRGKKRKRNKIGKECEVDSTGATCKEMQRKEYLERCNRQGKEGSFRAAAGNSMLGWVKMNGDRNQHGYIKTITQYSPMQC